MSKIFSPGDRVLTIRDCEIRTGEVVNAYYDIAPAVIIVNFDDGETEKIHPSKLAHEPKTVNPEEVRKSITYDEFSNALKAVTNPEMILEEMGEGGSIYDAINQGAGALMIGGKMGKELYGDDEYRIDISAEELTRLIESHTENELFTKCGDEMSYIDIYMSVGFSRYILKKIVPILFETVDYD